jgi:hypothetical protein
MGEKRNPARKPERRSHIRRLKCTPENNLQQISKVQVITVWSELKGFRIGFC